MTSFAELDEELGLEGRAQSDDHIDTKIWLRLLSISRQIENELRRRLRAKFKTTLPRFDYLAQLERRPNGLRMNQLSRFLMVSGGNVTGLTDQLLGEGLISRTDDVNDRRSYIVSLTPRGRQYFSRLATAHEGWLLEMMGDLPAALKESLYKNLGTARGKLKT